MDIKRHVAGGLNPGQRYLIKSRARNLLLSGGYGSGKTFGGALKTLQLRQENDSHGLIIAPTFQHLYSVSLEQLNVVLRALKVPQSAWYKIKDRQFERYMDFGDGKKVYLRSADNPGSLEGLNVGWVWMDESRLIRETAKNIAKGRMRTPCARPQFVCTTTPDLNWLYDEFMTGKPNREVIRASTRENERNLGEGFIEDLRFSFSKRLQLAAIEGHFTVLEGAVFEDFNPDANSSPWIVPYSPLPFRHRHTTLAVDPGYRKSSWHWWHKIGPDQWVMFDQFQGESMSTAGCVDYIRKNKAWPIDEVWVDPAADNTEQATGIDSLEYLKSLPFRFEAKRPPIYMIRDPWRSIQWGVEKTRALLGQPDSTKRILFSRRLADEERGSRRGILKSMAGYRYPEAKPGRPISPIPLKDGVFDHDIDCLRYFVVGKLLSTECIRGRIYEFASISDPGFVQAA